MCGTVLFEKSHAYINFAWVFRSMMSSDALDFLGVDDLLHECAGVVGEAREA
jgi:hypothetical protein